MLNKIILQGRLVADPELRQTKAEPPVPVCSFRIAVDRDFKDKETGKKVADFISCSAWRSNAEFVSKYFHKGSTIIVEGRLQNTSWETEQGVRKDNEVKVDNAYFGDSKRDPAEASTASEPPVGVYPPDFTPDFWFISWCNRHAARTHVLAACPSISDTAGVTPPASRNEVTVCLERDIELRLPRLLHLCSIWASWLRI